MSAVTFSAAAVLGNSRVINNPSRGAGSLPVHLPPPTFAVLKQRPLAIGALQSSLGSASLRSWSSSSIAAAAVRDSSPELSKEINEELKVCEFSDDVLDIVEDESDNFNIVNTATALLRVARISGNLAHEARQELFQDSRFLKLMGLVQYHAGSMRPRELCSILQSMVYLRYQCRDTLAAVTAAAEASIGQFNERDVSSMIWCLASLKVKKLPPRLMVQLVAQATDLVEQMNAQGISMMLWGLATLEYTPKQALLDKSTVQIKRRIEEFSERPQALTNSLWGLTKMNYFPRAAIVATIRLFKNSEAARDRLQNVNRPQEIVNLLWVFARCTVDPGEAVLRILDTYVLDNIQSLSPHDVSTIAWVYATLGYAPSDNLIGKLGAEAIAKLDKFTVDSAINFIWSMTLLGFESHPALPKLLETVELGNANEGLDEKSARQMFQAHLLAEQAGAPWTPSTELRTAGALQWITSLTQGRVRNHFAMHQLSAELRALGVAHEMMHSTPDKVLRADLAIKTTSGDWLAIRVLRRNRDHARNGLRQTGSYLAWKKLMSGRGYTVLEVYEQEIVDFVESGTGPDVLSSLLAPYEIEKVEAPVVMASLKAQGDAVELSTEEAEELRQKASGPADEWAHGA